MARDLVLDDLRGIDEEHLHVLGLVCRAPLQLRRPHTPRNMLPFAGSLSLVALAGADAIRECDTDEAWLREHEAAMASEEFRTASEALCRLPGVSLPGNPCSLVARPEQPL